MTKKRRIVDMSTEAIARRWRDLGQLYDLGMSLKTAKFLGPVNPGAKVDLSSVGLVRVEPSAQLLHTAPLEYR